MIWNTISVLLDQGTKDKTSVYGTNYLEPLLEILSKEELTSSLGGNGPALRPGGVYQPYERHADTTTIEIPAGRCYMMDIEIQKEGKLEWVFHSQEKDIGFAVYKIDGKEKKELFPWIRQFSNSGILDVAPGQYAILWDNKYSWTKKKTIHYHIDIITNSTENIT